MADTKQERFPDYPIFKGLQRPLEFFGLQVSWQDSCCLSSPWLSVAFSSS